MGKLVVSVFVTIDGVIERPDRWAFQYVSGDSVEHSLKQIRQAEALLLGRFTYEGFAAAWPYLSDDAGYADKLNAMPKYAVSATLERAEWNNTTVIRENVLHEIGKLKAELSGDLLVFGSGELVRRLLPHDVIDEIRLITCPVVMGEGERLFDGGMPTTFDLVDVTAFRSGAIVLTYAPTGHDPALP
ncbi:dihydrofolate reductase family protein [Actinomadura fulvescens]|uniref:Dihydrofolate reductase family protein n=1 Tax=Actinomadura fulvescens TaxID=46160 RepID=A0ABP6BTG1_9ACTN